MAKCYKCGAEILEGALFCTECGAALTQPFEADSKVDVDEGFGAAGASMSNYGKPQYNKDEKPTWGTPEHPAWSESDQKAQENQQAWSAGQNQQAWGAGQSFNQEANQAYNQGYNETPNYGGYQDGGYQGYDQYADGPQGSDKLWAVLSYFSILLWCISYLVTGSRGYRSNFLKFHLNQALVLAVAEIIAGVIENFFDGIGGFLGLAIFVYLVFGIVTAVQGRIKELPPMDRFRLIK